MQTSLSFKILGLIIVVVVVLDQITKYIVKTSMYLHQSIPVIGNFFQFTYVENSGMAFGVRLGNPVVFMGLSIVAAILVFYYLYRMRGHNWLPQIALAFISAGAIGNLYDRFVYGRVIDFLDFEFWDINIPTFKIIGMNFSGYSMTRWPVFNVADMAVTCGMIIIISYLVFIGDPLKITDNSTAVQANEAPNGSL
jgi:signal peptidase II